MIREDKYHTYQNHVLQSDTVRVTINLRVQSDTVRVTREDKYHTYKIEPGRVPGPWIAAQRRGDSDELEPGKSVEVTTGGAVCRL